MTSTENVDALMCTGPLDDAPTVEKLLWDCKEGRLESVKHATATLPLPYTDKWGRSALHYASAGRDVSVALHLHSIGLDINSKDKRQQTALHVACQQGNLTMATCLLEQCGADVSADKDGLTVLHWCVRHPQVVKYKELVTLLLKHGVNINAQTKQGQTALHFACEGNNVDAVECLISLKADVGIPDKDELSPLLVAAIKGSVDVIPLLVQSGADMNSKDTTGRTALHAACSEGHDGVVTTLIELGANQAALDKEGNIPLQKACQYGHYGIALTLIERGSDIHSIDRNGQASLHKACKGKDTQERRDLVKYLLRAGAKMDLQSRFARCALHCTCEDGNLGAATILLENKCKPNLQDNDGRTPLHYAALAGFSKYAVYCDIVTLLLASGSGPNEPDKKLMTAVHIAAKMGNLEILKKLLEHGGDANLLCQELKSPLHYSVLGDPPRIEPSIEVLEFLLTHHKDINVKDERGNTPLHYASQRGNINIVNLLVTKGASTTVKNNDDKLPEDLADHAGVKNILVAAKQCSIYSQLGGMIPLSSIKLYLTGYKQAGKTTLRKSLGTSDCRRPPSMHERCPDNQERTAGIEIEYIEHAAFGTLVVHDMAGHCEYSTSHSVVIDCADTSVFMVVFDITNARKAAWTQVNHWSAFIKAGRYKGSRPRVMLVATHVDEAVGNAEIEYNITFSKWKSSYSKFFRIVDVPFMVNALLPDTQEIDQIRSSIGTCCKEIKATVKVPAVCFDLMQSLRTIFGDMLAMKVEEVVVKIQHHCPSLYRGSDELMDLLSYLSIMGMILFLKCGWVIFMKEALLEEIFSIIFAPERFYFEDLSEFRHGKIPTVRIEGLFHKKYHRQLVLDILCELMLGKVDGDSSGEYIHIPSLLKEGTKNDHWKCDAKYHVFGGLRAKCYDETDIFSPCSFSKLQVTFLNKASFRHGLTLWVNGILVMRDRVQVLISMKTNRRSIDVCVRGEKGTEKQCCRIRQEMWELLSCELQNSSSGTNYNRQIIRPLDIMADSPFAYDYNYVLEQEKDGSVYISVDGNTESRDSIKELLYCNSRDAPFNAGVDFPQEPPTDAQLWNIAVDISDCWYQIGAQIGLLKSTLDRIDAENTEADMRSFQMLNMAREKPCFTSCADLAKLLYNTNRHYVNDHLRL